MSYRFGAGRCREQGVDDGCSVRALDHSELIPRCLCQAPSQIKGLLHIELSSQLRQCSDLSCYVPAIPHPESDHQFG